MEENYLEKEAKSLSSITYPNGTTIRVRYVKPFLGGLVFESEDINVAQATKMSDDDGLEIVLLIANFNQLKSLGFSRKEIKSILAHEIGHFRVENQNHGDIEAEIQADNYSVKMFGKDHLISSLIKSITYFGINDDGSTNKTLIYESCERLYWLGVLVTDVYSEDGIYCKVTYENI